MVAPTFFNPHFRNNSQRNSKLLINEKEKILRKLQRAIILEEDARNELAKKTSDFNNEKTDLEFLNRKLKTDLELLNSELKSTGEDVNENENQIYVIKNI